LNYSTHLYLSPGNEFTLETIIEMGLEQYAETIMDISSAASNELSIEKAIATIGEQWVDLKLEIDTYKDRGHYRLK